MEVRWTRLILIALPLIWSCSDQRNGEGDFDASPRLQLHNDAKIPILEIGVPDIPDALPDPCESVSSTSHSDWCECNPSCCEVQQWHCPPRPDNSIRRMRVVVEICDENRNPCIYGRDENCPPPEIIEEGECELAFDCNPTADIDFVEWYDCELEDGTFGKQQIWCNKGQLIHGPCRPCEEEICDGEDNDCDAVVDEDLGVSACETECGSGNAVCVNGEEICFGPEPQEEICDYSDNDCDGVVDEFQTNVCALCGPVPAESCDGIDNDCDNSVDENLVRACTTDCGSGVEVCDGGSWAGCTAASPSPEICDGIDNDCNGQIDDGIECLCTIQDVGSLFPCAEPPLLCGQGFKTCLCIDPNCEEITTSECFSVCHWLADPPGSDLECESFVGMPLAEEECNDFDDNCNQLVDEDLFQGCYTGPEGTINVGICGPGMMTCLTGVWGGYDEQENFFPGMCMDETLPSNEECNGIDDDCDGVIDWGEEVPDTDILFIVDWSGSMGDEINAVLTALNQFAAHYSLQDTLRWGLIVGPRDLGRGNEKLQIISDISPFQDFLRDFAGLGNIGMDTGSEMLLDAIYLSLQNISANAPIDLAAAEWARGVAESIPEKESFNLSWRPGANRVIIVFTDEVQQSYLNPQITTEQAISTCLGTPQSKLYAFSTNERWEWDEISHQCNGTYYHLSSNAVQMYNSLMEILLEICIPRED